MLGHLFLKYYRPSGIDSAFNNCVYPIRGGRESLSIYT